MWHRRISSRRTNGFTVVELIIVISVIAILAGVTIIGYGSWKNSVDSAAVKSDLLAAASAMEDSRNFNNAYPASVPNTFSPSSNVSIAVESSSASAYCLDGTNSNNAAIQYYVASETKDKGAISGTCATRASVIAPTVPANVAIISAFGTTVNLTWDTAAYASSYKAQCASDPAFIYDLVEQSSATNNVVFSGISIGSTVFCRSKAINSIGESGWTAGISATTSNNYGSLSEGTSISGYWSTAPVGFIAEDGAAVSRTTYSDLFAVIGTTYGNGDGSTTFNLPDSRGRSEVNLSSSDIEFNQMGEKSGTKTETITIPQMPSHGHTQNAHTHLQDPHTNILTDPGHNHTQNAHDHTQNAHDHNGGFANPYVSDGSFGTINVSAANGSNYGYRYGAAQPLTVAVNQNTTGVNNSSLSGITVTSTVATNQSSTAVNNNTGSDVAHNNIQPSIVKKFAIKYTKIDSSASLLPEGASINGYWSTAPTGYLLEDGSAVSRTTYPELFALIGTTYGVGNGSTTFNLPDSRGRISVNKNPTDIEFDTIGEKYGEKSHILTIAEMPSHTHTQNAHTHTQNAHTHTVSDPGHNHTQNAHNHTQNAHDHNGGFANPYLNDSTFGGGSTPTLAGLTYGFKLGASASTVAVNNATTATNNAAVTSVSLYSTTATNQSITATNQSTGGDQAHNEIQPSIVVLSAIKATPASSTSRPSVDPGTSISGYWSTVPTGFLVEDGSAISRTTYSTLFAIIGTSFGAGNGSTTFNLPDSKGRTGVNLSLTDTEFDLLGEKPGSKTEALSIAQMPSHTHIQDPHTNLQNTHTHSVYDPGHTHSQNAHTHTQNSHNHGSGYVSDGSFGGSSAISATGGSFGFYVGPQPSVVATNQSATATNNASFTGVSVNSIAATNQSATATNNNTGGGGTHNNIQPSIVKLFVIKY